ncbi:helix-turn-helix domain-containing protein [Gracilimonas tropica]|uniref:helix-turn-helix domain-containing protein n=1 Tax=Gracilimonas tropica TaxID=454600 RepID=UPI000373287C|nr:helix-turn-helix domain-containing protein [Gracilimonas tropica]
MTTKAYQKPLNVEEAAEFLDLSKSHLYKLTSRGEIPHYKPTGKRLYFLPEDLIEYLKAGRVKTNRELDQEAAKYVAQ